MKDKFPGWYQKSSEEVSSLWDTAVFIPDANVLLHCLRHPATVRDELLRLFEVLEDSLWIPYQVGLEFHRNRLDVELDAEDTYEVLVRDQESVFEKARDRLRRLRAHPVINVEKELSALDMFLKDFRDRMKTAQSAHCRHEIAEAVERLTSALNGRIGDKWTLDRLTAIKKEGEERYSKKIPPGYKDAKKDSGEFDKFGDLIIWKDMIAKATDEKRPVIFISDDVKEDWWWIHKGRKLGPRPELVEEFRDGSGQNFHIYEFSQFLRFAADRYPEIKPGVDQVEKSLLDDEMARKRQNEAAEAHARQAEIRQLEDERDHLIALLSGTPGARMKEANLDRAELRSRLQYLNSEIDSLTEPATDGTAEASESQDSEL